MDFKGSKQQPESPQLLTAYRADITEQTSFYYSTPLFSSLPHIYDTNTYKKKCRHKVKQNHNSNSDLILTNSHNHGTQKLYNTTK